MKIAHLFIIVLLAITGTAMAQTDDLQKSLRALDPAVANQVTDGGPEVLYARDVVLDIVPIAKRFGITFDNLGAKSLIDYLTQGEIAKALQEKPPIEPPMVLANRHRFSLLVLAHAQPEGARLIVTATSIERLRRGIAQKLIEGFCPCFPFCK